jgi:hypothetical protein
LTDVVPRVSISKDLVCKKHVLLHGSDGNSYSEEHGFIVVGRYKKLLCARNIEVLCGNQRDWSRLSFLVKYFGLSDWDLYLQICGIPRSEPIRAFTPRNFVESAASDFAALRNELTARHGKFSPGSILAETLYKSMALQCTDPRDMIYNVLGVIQLMLGTHTPPPIRIDYTIDVLEVWINAIKLCFETCPSLAILSLKNDETLTSDLPSWIPDLQELSKHPLGVTLGLHRRTPRETIYNVQYNFLNMSPYRDIQGRVLHLKSSKFGILTLCGSKFTADRSAGAPPALILPSMFEICDALPRRMGNGEDGIQALWQTLVGWNPRHPVRPDSSEMRQGFHDWILALLFYLRAETRHVLGMLTRIAEGILGLYKGSPADCPLPNLAKYHVWWKSLNAASFGSTYEENTKYLPLASYNRFSQELIIHHRVLFSTSQGDLGSGPASSLPGDELWVLENGRVPFILRPT